MLESFIRPILAIIISVADVGLEDASSVVAAEVVGGALHRAAGGRLVGEVLAVRRT